jgi:hypothetical protein
MEAAPAARDAASTSPHATGEDLRASSSGGVALGAAADATAALAEGDVDLAASCLGGDMVDAPANGGDDLSASSSEDEASGTVNAAPGPPAATYEEAPAAAPLQLLEVTHPVTLEDVVESIHISPNTSPGPMGIPYSVLRKLPCRYVATLTAMFNLSLATGFMPDCYLRGHICPIGKKGPPSVENSRPLTLLTTSMKVLNRIVNRRLVHGLLDSGYWSEWQFGFLYRFPNCKRGSTRLYKTSLPQRAGKLEMQQGRKRRKNICVNECCALAIGCGGL